MDANKPARNPVRVFFPVEQDESGYPAVSREQIWCVPTKDDLFLVDNTPFYAREISMGDEISVERRGRELWFSKLHKRSRNTTLRAFARNDDFAPALIPKLRSFGGVTEKMEGSPLIAVSLPPGADIAGALEFLDRESAVGNVAFEESSVRYR